MVLFYVYTNREVVGRIWLYPPSTGIAAPVIKLLSADARNTIAFRHLVGL